MSGDTVRRYDYDMNGRTWCSECGSGVSDRAAHERMHKRIEALEAAARTPANAARPSVDGAEGDA